MQTAALDGLYKDACLIIDKTQQTAYHVVNEMLIKRNWLLGMLFQHEVLKEQRAEYGEQVIKMLAKELTAKYGNGYSRNNLYRFISFYKSFPNIFHAVNGSLEIVPSVTGQSEKVPSLTGQSAIADFYASLMPTQPL